jgi:hypothetical protein
MSFRHTHSLNHRRNRSHLVIGKSGSPNNDEYFTACCGMVPAHVNAGNDSHAAIVDLNHAQLRHEDRQTHTRPTPPTPHCD